MNNDKFIYLRMFKDKFSQKYLDLIHENKVSQMYLKPIKKDQES